MSNALAIAAATATLRNLIVQGVPDLPNQNITTRPLDKARTGTASVDQLNLFLYQTTINAAWRNMDMPRQVHPGETGRPPLALNLHYLLTAFGQDDDDAQSHRWLGKAMSILHDHPLLGRQEIQDALSGSGLQSQIERVRITPQPLSIEEISKLWTAFQTQYRISAAYELTVLLIDSTQSGLAPLPVLKRGAQDQGAITIASPSPSLTAVKPDVQPANIQPSGHLGDDLILEGVHLRGDGVTVRFTRQPQAPSTAVPETIDLAPMPGGSEEELRVHLQDLGDDPQAYHKWAPGFYNVSLLVALPDLPAWTTNEVPFALAPSITVTPQTAPAGNLLLTVTCAPRVRDDQRVWLLFGNRRIPVHGLSNPADVTQPSTLTFQVPSAAAGTYVVRLRVDGVDSLPIVRSGTPPVLGFDPNQQVIIT